VPPPFQHPAGSHRIRADMSAPRSLGDVARPLLPDASGLCLEALTEDAKFVLSRSCPSGDTAPVLVLAPTRDAPLADVAARLEHEYALAAALDPAWAVRPLALARQEGKTVLELEDPGGLPLDRLLGRPLEFGLFLRLAVGLAAALGQVHQRGLIYKDLKPAHALVDPVTGEVHLTGFGLASHLLREHQAPAAPEVLAGTLAYMAPEQTGRMNRSIDARSDLYALGVTLYEMLTGALPFTAADPLGWVHCHIARAPLPPAERVPGIPGLLSDLILKLLAKAPEDRYQTAAGVEADLRRCQEAWERQGRVESFPLGSRDVPDQLLIPEKLYGREREIATLLAAFERVACEGQPEWMLVSGYAGIGKSSVVNELHQALVTRRGLFASGKFDQHKRDVPYATLAQAFQGLIRQLLAKSETELSPWRSRLQQAIAPSGKLLTDLIPALERVIGPQPPVPELPAQEQQHRFQAVFRRFLGVFARPDQPLVLFLDDLQWLDTATLALLEHLAARPDLRHLLLIGAYRDNEVSPSHPLLLTLEAIRKAGGTIREITLRPLTRDDLRRLVADTLHVAPAAAAPLARWMHEKTGGNPFFAIQFLSVLAEEGLLAFDATASAWTWDVERIRAQGYTDNVVELMVAKLKRLPPITQSALQRLASLGNIVESATLAMVQEVPEAAVHAALHDALRAGLVCRHDGTYRFLHDRIQEAAYALIPSQDRAGLHLHNGRQCLARMAIGDIGSLLFDVVDQLNRGSELLSDPAETLRVAELNLAAGRRAKASAAYGAACIYLATSSALLENDAWQRRYDLAYPLWLERAECELLSGQLDRAEELIAQLLEQGQSPVDRAAVYHLKVQLHVLKSEHAKAVDSALAGLRLFGIDLPAHPTGEQVQAEYEQVWKRLGERPIESLIDLPLTNDPQMNAAMRILAVLFDAAYFTDSQLFVLHFCRMVRLGLEHGHSFAAAHGYAWFGWILGPFFHRYREGYRFVRLGCDMLEKHGLLAGQSRVHFALQSAASFARPLSEALDHAAVTIRSGTETGDLSTACYGWLYSVDTRLVRGDPLDEVWREAGKTLDFCRKCQFVDAMQIARVLRRFIAQMQGQGAGVVHPDEPEPFDEAAFEAQLTPERMSSLVCWYWILKVQTRFLQGDAAAALAAARQAHASLAGAAGQIHLLNYHYYAALTLTALYEAAPSPQRRDWHAQLVSHRAQLREWAEFNPPTFHDKHALVCAEIARLEGRDAEAMRLYQQAIQSARENGFVQYQGVAHEVAARYYLARSLETEAVAHLDEARACFARWGAGGKVSQLDAGYPQLRARKISTAPASGAQLDVLSVAKAAQAISGQILLDELIDTLLRIVIENAGAQSGALLLVRDDELILAAAACTDQQTVQVRHREQQGVPSEGSLPLSILNYVRRSQEPVLLDDAARPHPYAGDAYFARSHPKSVLCLPILRQSALIGLLYLEHYAVTHVFTPERVTVLDLLAGQAAISLENARLYGDLREEIRERKEAEERMHALALERDRAREQALLHQKLALHRAQFDELTRLPNRAKFRDDLHERCAQLAPRAHLALLTLGLDRFSAINHTLGPKIGDSVLSEIAERLKQRLPDSALLARCGADVFAWVVDVAADEEDLVRVSQQGEALQKAVAAPLVLGHGVTLTGSLGLALYPDHPAGADELMQASATALHRAKARGHGNLQWFDPAMHQTASRFLELNKELHEALDQNQLELHYQPIVALASGALLGVEALARWQRTDGRFIGPEQFVPVAEGGDLLRPFTEWTIRSACRQMADWRERGIAVPYLSINLSPAQLRLSHLDDYLLEQLREAGVPGTALTIEVTEGALLENLEAARGLLSRLRLQGLAVAVDDFGIGYASPHYLRALPVDILKIDGSFLKDVPENPEACSLLNGIIEIGHSLRLKVVTEVVETREQAVYLAGRGVAAGQGHWFSRSLPASALEAWLRQQPAPPVAGSR